MEVSELFRKGETRNYKLMHVQNRASKNFFHPYFSFCSSPFRKSNSYMQHPRNSMLNTNSKGEEAKQLIQQTTRTTSLKASAGPKKPGPIPLDMSYRRCIGYGRTRDEIPHILQGRPKWRLVKKRVKSSSWLCLVCWQRRWASQNPNKVK